MSELNKKTLQSLKTLCRIECSPEEEEEIISNLKKVIEYSEKLNEVDTEDIWPCNHILQSMQKNVFRKDKIGKTLNRDTFLQNSPSNVAGMIKVPPILKKE